MKLLKTEFQSNVDQTGLQTFKQLSRSKDVAIYQRIRKDNTTHSFEVFRIKTVKEGAALPNGTFVTEAYEAYPGKGGFGMWARSCKTEGQANHYFDVITKQLKENETADTASAAVDELESAESGSAAPSAPKVPGKRGRKGIDKSSIKFPEKEQFLMDEAKAMNTHVSFATVYQYLQALIKKNLFKVVGKQTGGRGKAKVVYQAC